MKNSLRKIFTLMSIGLASLFFTNWLYADDACCKTINNSVTTFDKHNSDNLKKISDILNNYVVHLDDTITSALSQFFAYNNTTSAFTDNAIINNQISSLTTKLLEKQMTTNPKDQAKVVGEMSQLMPAGNGNNDFDVNNYAMSTLMNNPGLDEKQLETAKNLIKIVSSYGNTAKNISGKISSDNMRAKEYLASLGTYNAMQSNAVNLLNRILEERTMSEALGKTVGERAISQMQLDTKTVNEALAFNTTDKDPGASLLEIAKAQYYVSAHSQYELFKIRQELQQLNVTLVLNSIQQMNNINRLALDGARQVATSATQ